MSWKRLKTFAIVLLVIMDALFLFLILKRNYSATHYDASLVAAAEKIFEESGFSVNPALLKQKIVKLPVYVGDANTHYVSGKTEMFEKAGYHVSAEPGGVYCKDEDGEFFFGDDFAFSYLQDGVYERPSYELRMGGYSEVTDKAFCKSLEKTINQFWKSHFEGLFKKAGERYEFAYTGFYVSGYRYIAKMEQKIDGTPLKGEICIAVTGGEVTAMDGTLVTSAPYEKRKAENVTLLTVLLSEKARNDRMKTEMATENHPVLCVSHVEYRYTLYFDSDRNFYFIPLCTVYYDNGEKTCYNYVTGNLYS